MPALAQRPDNLVHSSWCRVRVAETNIESRAGPTDLPPERRSRRVPTMASVPPDLMPAAVYVGDGRIAVEEVPCPEPGPGEVLVEIAECGICGSDLHMVLERYARPGAILGHEWSGIVASAPSGSGWSDGDRVVGNQSPGVWPMPALPTGTSLGVPRPSAGGLPGLPRCVLPVQDRRVRRPDPYSRFPPDPGGRADRADGDRPARGADGRRGARRPGAGHRGRAGRIAHHRGVRARRGSPTSR